jgi:LmbE family N-acetylglucosaminyl deacetylase
MALARTTRELIRLRAKPRRILAVFPHPDDEAYGCSGALARAGLDPDAAAVLFCLTRGEASSMAAEFGLTPSEIGEMREGRLREVAGILGLDGLIVGNFPDSRLARVEVRQVASEIRAVLEALRPQVVIGHDPRGVNAHLDHVASHWTLRRALEDRPEIRFAMVAYGPEVCEAIKPRLLLSTPEEEMDAILHLSEGEAGRKEACLRVHDALVSLDRETAKAKGLLWRPPVETYDFLGEDCTPAVDDLFAGIDTEE